MSSKKEFNINDLLKKISTLKREQNFNIGFTNGCFDFGDRPRVWNLFHYGTSYFWQFLTKLIIYTVS